MNEIVADEKDISDEILLNYLKYQNLSLLAKNLIRTKRAKNKQLVNNINDELFHLRNAICRCCMIQMVKMISQ